MSTKLRWHPYAPCYLCSVSFMTRMVFLNFQDIVVAPYFHVIGKKCTHTKKIHMALSKDFRKVSKRGKCLFFGFLEIISSKNENRWDVHPYLRLHYIITKKRRIFYEWLTIHLGFCDLTLIIANTWWSICSVSLYYSHSLSDIHEVHLSLYTDSFYNYIC